MLGKQTFGQSSEPIYQMALKAFNHVGLQGASIADIGAGQGNLSQYLYQEAKSITLVDDFEPINLLGKCSWIKSDLNSHWKLLDSSFDFVFALEVIEHLENPRHFFRELTRIIKPGGFGFVSTPHNESFFSKLFFIFTGKHRWFQESCYPAHITPVLKIDFERYLFENNLLPRGFFYSNEDTVPKLQLRLSVTSKAFSKNFGVLFQKPS